ncbi:hypothetical protein BOQ62_10620 [Chryseobacterium sp. CH21]|uniref:hypothetical protein n=1 Tax=Chryseobacterium sp. CH21 TaxID=713556 RepID=UPI00100B535A|nr:hypothetical protein [Chryseobacterium sp. CH21]RXM39617.1 hypothetical protein BOQ62_10620 [Chryseobacterium sp. CH21]
MAEHYAYENNRLKTSTIIAGTDFGDAVTEEYTYDDFGNVTQKKSMTGYDDKTLVEKAQYDDQGKFVIKKQIISVWKLILLIMTGGRFSQKKIPIIISRPIPMISGEN